MESFFNFPCYFSFDKTAIHRERIIMFLQDHCRQTQAINSTLLEKCKKDSNTFSKLEGYLKACFNKESLTVSLLEKTRPLHIWVPAPLKLKKPSRYRLWGGTFKIYSRYVLKITKPYWILHWIGKSHYFPVTMPLTELHRFSGFRTHITEFIKVTMQNSQVSHGHFH